MFEDKQSKHYEHGMSRRDSLKWLSLLVAGSAATAISGQAISKQVTGKVAGHWPNFAPEPISAKGYGTDPNLIVPPESPWPRTLTQKQLNTVAQLADILIPREGETPSASEVKVPDVIDEWVSAPYITQQSDRDSILRLLIWLDDESMLRFSQTFTNLPHSEKISIVDDIAFIHSQQNKEFARPSKAFSRFRELVLAAFYCSPTGIKDIGYIGNVALAGDYPGPSDEALSHLKTVLTELELSDFADFNGL